MMARRTAAAIHTGGGHSYRTIKKQEDAAAFSRSLCLWLLTCRAACRKARTLPASR